MINKFRNYLIKLIKIFCRGRNFSFYRRSCKRFEEEIALSDYREYINSFSVSMDCVNCSMFNLSWNDEHIEIIRSFAVSPTK